MMKQIISAHNRKVLAARKPPAPEEEKPRPCNCPKKKRLAGECPLQGKCMVPNVIYQAEVVETKLDGEVKVEKYVGSTTDFKDRLGNHEKSFKHERYKHETVLSSHIWECKERGSTYTVTWKALDRGQPFNPVTKTCKLCTREKFYIIRKPHQATLNHRQEIGAHCRHIAMSLISKVKKVKVG